jgi:hypothetical protein
MIRLGSSSLAVLFWMTSLVIGWGDDPVDSSRATLLDAKSLLAQETFWDNRDVNWFAANIPLFECPDRELQTT